MGLTLSDDLGLYDLEKYGSQERWWDLLRFLFALHCFIYSHELYDHGKQR